MSAFIAMVALCSFSPPNATTSDPSSLAHLPETVRRDVEAWRYKLTTAKCLKVICDTDETWANLHELGSRGVPRVVLRERFQIHSWMTPDQLWVVIFPYKGESPDTSRPVFQEFWSAKQGMAWERSWDAKSESHRVRWYACTEKFGPTEIGVETRGCIYATVTESWLAGRANLADRTISVVSVGLLRKPNLAMVPPDPAALGVWLDVFQDSVPRDQEPEVESFYRRQDFMLLARNATGDPEVREWRTLVVNDPKDGGQRPQQITGFGSCRTRSSSGCRAN